MGSWQYFKSLWECVVITDATLNVNKEILHPNGDVTWMPVNMETEVEEGVYQVFNTLTGLYEKCETLAQAKEKYAELAEKVVAHFTPSPLQLEADLEMVIDKLHENNKKIHASVIRLDQAVQSNSEQQ
jgi:glutathionyl-hydroquinone reductase